MRNILYTLFILILVSKGVAIAQIAPDHYLINFTDKYHSEYSIDKAEEFLSKRAIERRKKFGIAITKEDLPVSRYYLDSLKALGLKIVNSSKWTNSASVYTKDSLLIDTIENLSFISHVGIKKFECKKNKQDTAGSNLLEVTDTSKPHKQSKNNEIIPFSEFKKSKEYSHYDKIYGKSLRQVQISNCHLLHKEGYKGKGVHIAILDAGFYRVDSLPAFENMRNNKQIIGVKDFVDNDSMVYDASTHGMKVFSTMAGYIPHKLYGTAPEAKYWLLRTEQAESEYIIEEYNWISAVEFADSAGVDLINSSLGYSTFDDSLTNHSYKDLDGKATAISRAANIAASKGILVVVSAGNEGFNKWKYITVPADADSVLAVGAVTKNGKKSYFSSFGLSDDNRIKPDVCAIGSASVVSGRYGKVSAASGTSFAAPIMAGMLACLIQAHPKLSNIELINILRQTSSHYNNPNDSIGYGIPDIYASHLLAKQKEKKDR